MAFTADLNTANCNTMFQKRDGGRILCAYPSYDSSSAISKVYTFNLIY